MYGAIKAKFVYENLQNVQLDHENINHLLMRLTSQSYDIKWAYAQYSKHLEKQDKRNIVE